MPARSAQRVDVGLELIIVPIDSGKLVSMVKGDSGMGEFKVHHGVAFF